MSTLQGVRIVVDRLNKTANYLFEIQGEEPTGEEITWGIKRHKELIELIITHVTLLRYLDLQELAVFFDPATSSESIVTFGMGATNLPSYILPQFQKMFQDFNLVQAPTDTTVGKLPAAYMRINYSLAIPDGRTFPTASELWIVPRGDYFFMIGAGTRQDGKTGSREEITKILSSVEL